MTALPIEPPRRHVAVEGGLDVRGAAGLPTGEGRAFAPVGSIVADPPPDGPATARIRAFLVSARADRMRRLPARRPGQHGSLDGWVTTFPIRPDTIERLRHARVG